MHSHETKNKNTLHDRKPIHCQTNSNNKRGCATIQSKNLDIHSDQQQSVDKHYSWRILGMDCPSCANKIEKIVKSITGVTRAQVIFASEKLKVDSRIDVTSQIELAVTEAGFKLVAYTTPVETPLFSWRENKLFIVLTLLVAIGTLLTRFSTIWADGLFIITTLVGLYSPACAAWRSLRQKSPFVIETLMTVAGIGALLIGAYAEAAMVILLFLLGEQLESYAAGRARRGITALMALKPEYAIRLNNGSRESVSLNALMPGDIIEVAAGSRVPADGRLLDDFASFDQSAITGESLPIEYQRDAIIAAGSTSTDKLVKLIVTSQPGESTIDRILHLIEEASSHRAPVERTIDRFSRIYTPIIMLIALLVMILPPLLSGADWYSWLYKGLALLLIGCPCALVIATPAAITSGLASAAKRGVLIKGGAALEQLSNLSLLAFDKTGTLTVGKPHVTEIIRFIEISENDLLALAAAVEQGSTHPLAQAIVNYATHQQVVVLKAEQQHTLLGSGIQATIEGQQITLRSPAKSSMLTTLQLQKLQQLEQQGQTLMVLTQDDIALGAIAVRDKLRPEAQSAIAKLHALGIKNIMLTGDNLYAAATIANELNISFQAGLLPEDKVKAVNQIKQRGSIGMVGDGINDTPAMKAATIGIAMGGGTDVALESADVALTRNDLNALPEMIQRARTARNVMNQNISIALGLKVLFLITTILGMTGLWMAVLADSGATALVTLNALRLLKAKI